MKNELEVCKNYSDGKCLITLKDCSFPYPICDMYNSRIGKWIWERDVTDVSSDYRCSECGYDDTFHNRNLIKFYKYCPYCGVRMIEVVGESDE